MRAAVPETDLTCRKGKRVGEIRREDRKQKSLKRVGGSDWLMRKRADWPMKS